MASVQELIAAAQADSPRGGTSSVLQNFLGGLEQRIGQNPADVAYRLAQLKAAETEQKINDVKLQQIKDEETVKAQRKEEIARRSKEMRDLVNRRGGKFVTKITDEGVEESFTFEDESAGKPSDVKLTDAQKEVDKQFAKDYNEYVVQGGYSDVEKNIGQLKDAYAKLTGKNYDTGQEVKGKKVSFATGRTVGVLPKEMRDVVAPEGAAIQDQIEEVVQRNLRLILGAQFTQKEGELLLRRSYNPRQSQEENARRVRRLVTQIEKAAKAKSEAGRYYEANGTLKGFSGPSYQYDPNELQDDMSKVSAVKILGARPR